MTVSEVKRYTADEQYPGQYAARCDLVAASAYDAAKSELAALREDLALEVAFKVLAEGIVEELRDDIREFKQLLTAAEQRNARYESLLRQIIPCLAMSTNTTAPTYIRQITEAFQQPTESGASE